MVEAPHSFYRSWPSAANINGSRYFKYISMSFGIYIIGIGNNFLACQPAVPGGGPSCTVAKCAGQAKKFPDYLLAVRIIYNGCCSALPRIVVVTRIIKLIGIRSEEHTSELQSRGHLVCRLLLE